MTRALGDGQEARGLAGHLHQALQVLQMCAEALGNLAGGIEFENEAAAGLLAAAFLIIAGIFLGGLGLCPFVSPVLSVQSHMAVRRASSSKPLASAPVKIMVRASLATAAQTCSRYSLSVTASPLAFSTRE